MSPPSQQLGSGSLHVSLGWNSCPGWPRPRVICPLLFASLTLSLTPVPPPDGSVPVTLAPCCSQMRPSGSSFTAFILLFPLPGSPFPAVPAPPSVLHLAVTFSLSPPKAMTHPGVSHTAPSGSCPNAERQPHKNVLRTLFSRSLVCSFALCLLQLSTWTLPVLFSTVSRA